MTEETRRSTGGAFVVLVHVPVVESISPRNGPIEGGSVVTVRGRNLGGRAGADVSCSFGPIRVPAQSIGAEEGEDLVTCMTPAVPASSIALGGGVPGEDGVSVPFGISVDGGDTVFDSSFSFDYLPPSRIMEAIPSSASSGGDVMISVRLQSPLLAANAPSAVAGGSSNALSSLLVRPSPGRVLSPGANATGADLVGIDATGSGFVFASSNGSATASPSSSSASNVANASMAEEIRVYCRLGGSSGLVVPAVYPGTPRNAVIGSGIEPATGWFNGLDGGATQSGSVASRWEDSVAIPLRRRFTQAEALASSGWSDPLMYVDCLVPAALAMAAVPRTLRPSGGSIVDP